MCDILIIDTSNMIMRAAKGIESGKANKLITNCLSMIQNSINYFNPGKVIMALDDYSVQNFRKTIYPDYKANRVRHKKTKEIEEDFNRQKNTIKHLLRKCLPVYCLQYPGYEADDVISAVCRITEGAKIVIWSMDNDLLQLQQKIKDVLVWNAEKQDYFQTPCYDIVTYKALVGDKSDNISGVKGIGKKTVLKIMSSNIEFIKNVTSKTHRYLEYRRNIRIIDLIDNDLCIPSDLISILSVLPKFDIDEFDSVLKHNNIRNEYVSSFFQLALKYKTKNNKYSFVEGEQ